MLNKKTIIFILVPLAIIIFGIVSYLFIFNTSRRTLNSAVKNMATIQNLHFTETASETKTNSEISNVSGDIVSPDKLRINLIPEIKDAETVIIDRNVYTSWLGNWTFVGNKKSEGFNIYNPQKFIDLLNFVSNVKSLGTEKISDQDMQHLGFTIDKNEAQKTFSQSGNINYNGEVWIGKDDGLIHRMTITFIPDNPDEAPIKYQMDFSNFNSDIKIEEPKI